MVQRLFPRLLDDLDPLRESEFPNADTLLAAIDPDLLAEIGDAQE